jgi:hypothetical protein
MWDVCLRLGPWATIGLALLILGNVITNFAAVRGRIVMLNDNTLAFNMMRLEAVSALGELVASTPSQDVRVFDGVIVAYPTLGYYAGWNVPLSSLAKIWLPHAQIERIEWVGRDGMMWNGSRFHMVAGLHEASQKATEPR